jgi:hypothetical protein
MEDIVLVTGCDLTRSWANIAFFQGRVEGRVSFGVQVTGASNIEWQFPPEERQGVALNLGPNGQVCFPVLFCLHRHRDNPCLMY